MTGVAASAPAASVPLSKLKISILSYGFRGLLKDGAMNMFGYLESCKYRYGLDAADIWSSFLTSTDEPYLRKIREALDEREIVLADLCTDGTYIWDNKPEVREKNYRNALRHLKAAEILGARFMRLDSGGVDPTWTDEQFDHIVNRYKEYAKWAHERGFKVGAENHWGAEKVWANLQTLYRAVDHPAFGLSIHVNASWAGTQEEKDAADRAVAPWVSHTHLDFGLTTGLAAARRETRQSLERRLQRLLQRRTPLRKGRIRRGCHPVGQGAERSGAFPYRAKPVPEAARLRGRGGRGVPLFQGLKREGRLFAGEPLYATSILCFPQPPEFGEVRRGLLGAAQVPQRPRQQIVNRFLLRRQDHCPFEQRQSGAQVSVPGSGSAPARTWDRRSPRATPGNGAVTAGRAPRWHCSGRGERPTGRWIRHLVALRRSPFPETRSPGDRR